MQKKDVKFLQYISGIFIVKYLPSNRIDFVRLVFLLLWCFHIPQENKKIALY